MKELNRKLVNRMVDKTSSNGGGGNSYVPQSQAVSWTDIDGKPTTLAGYGITDAYWATTQSTSDKRNLTIGSVTQQVITAHQSLSGYATEYWVGQQGFATTQWVGQQGFLTSSALSGYATQTWVGQQGFATQTWVGNNYLPFTGGTVTGNIYIGNTTIYASGSNGGINSLAVADDCILGDCNIAGHLGLKSLNSSYAGISFYDLNGSQVGQLSAYNGNIGIGTSTPSYKLHVAGGIYATGAITERSDIRCKDVETYQWAPSLSMIANAPIIRYSMKDDEAHRMRVGTVAQYWEKVMPEAVSKADDGILSIAQGDICMVCIIAMAREIERLKAKIND